MIEDYADLVRETLRALGGEKTCVPGAKLLHRVQQRAQVQGSNFQVELRADGRRFSEYLESLAPQIKVYKRGPADMLVGFDGAKFEVPENRRRREYSEFRADVYKAFSRTAKTPIVYDAVNDKFTDEPIEGGTPLPLLDRNHFIEERKQFVDASVEDESVRRLLSGSLESDSPLTAFRAVIAAAEMTEAWQSYKSRQMRSAVEKWASDNKIPIKDTWFRQLPKTEIKSIFLGMVALMSDDEVRQLSLPMRVVEAYFHKSK